MLNYTLGTIEASEALIKDLYIDLRAKVNAWSKITQQTPQARMGYVGQHLVSVVTGYPGGKSGARGYDLVIDDERHGEIKTCYRVDQLGSCNACGAVVSSLETECAVCSSTSINRKDDSKWLIAIRNNDEFAKLLDPYRYYFVLFEFESTTIVTLTVYRFKIIIIASSVYMLIVLTTFRNTLVLFQIQYNYACY